MKRYYGDHRVTKSEAKVYFDGETEPRMTFDAREPRFFNYTISFPGASSYCLPEGTFKMKVGNSPYSPMGLRIPRCAGHRCVFLGHKCTRESFEGEILIGQPIVIDFLDERVEVPVTPENRIESILRHEEETFAELTELVYEAYAKGEDFLIEIDNSEVLDCTILPRKKN